MTVSLISKLIILITATVLLHWRIQRRVIKEWAEEEDKIQWEGNAIDVTPVFDRVRKVRSDYGSVVSAISQDAEQSRLLLSVARKAIRRLAYFQH